MNFIVSHDVDLSYVGLRLIRQESLPTALPLSSSLDPNGRLLDEIDRSSTTSVVLRGTRETLFLCRERTKHDASYIIEIETFPYYYHRGHRLILRYYNGTVRSRGTRQRRRGESHSGATVTSSLRTRRDARGGRLCLNRFLPELWYTASLLYILCTIYSPVRSDYSLWEYLIPTPNRIRSQYYERSYIETS